MLTLETEFYGVELDRHGGGVRGRRQVVLVIVAVGDSRLRCTAHATEACYKREARVRSAGTDQGDSWGQGYSSVVLVVKDRGVVKGRAVVSLAE